MHILEDWRIRDIEQKAERACLRLYEMDAIRGDVDRLERENRELRSDITWLRAELEAYREKVDRLEQRVESHD